MYFNIIAGDVGIVEERTPCFSETAVAPSETKGENPMSYPADQFSGSEHPIYRFKHFTDEKVMMAVNQVYAICLVAMGTFHLYEIISWTCFMSQGSTRSELFTS